MHHPFGTFPKTHLIWYSHPSLNKTVSFFCDGGCCWWTSRWRRRRISRTSSSESESRLARPPPSPSHFTGETGGSQVISNQLWDKLASPLTRGHKKSKQTFLKRQCKGFKINLRGRTKYFVLKIIEILHIHLLLLKRVTLDWFPLLIPGVGNCWLFQSFLLMESEPYYWRHPPLHCASKLLQVAEIMQIQILFPDSGYP